MVQDPHLVPLLPVPFAGFACPACGGTALRMGPSVWPGVHVLQERTCTGCGHHYLQDLPVGFAVDHPMAIGLRDGALYNPTNGEPWIHEPLVRSFRSPQDREVRVERIVHRRCDRVIILNTLDFLYGHVLLKLYNAQHYLDRHPDLGLVLILPRMFQWLVPEGVAEVWLVDQRLGEAHGWYTAIDRFVQEQLPRYGEVYLGRGYAHPEFATMGLPPLTPDGDTFDDVVSDAILDLIDLDHRDWRFRRNTRSTAMPVAVEHDIADHQYRGLIETRHGQLHGQPIWK